MKASYRSLSIVSRSINVFVCERLTIFNNSMGQDKLLMRIWTEIFGSDDKVIHCYASELERSGLFASVGQLYSGLAKDRLELCQVGFSGSLFQG